jgi:hypothetical protein
MEGAMRALPQRALKEIKVFRFVIRTQKVPIDVLEWMAISAT